MPDTPGTLPHPDPAHQRMGSWSSRRITIRPGCSPVTEESRQALPYGRSGVVPRVDDGHARVVEVSRVSGSDCESSYSDRVGAWPITSFSAVMSSSVSPSSRPREKSSSPRSACCDRSSVALGTAVFAELAFTVPSSWSSIGSVCQATRHRTALAEPRCSRKLTGSEGGVQSLNPGTSAVVPRVTPT